LTAKAVALNVADVLTIWIMMAIRLNASGAYGPSGRKASMCARASASKSEMPSGCRATESAMTWSSSSLSATITDSLVGKYRLKVRGDTSAAAAI
jgi:hypothetical protein